MDALTNLCNFTDTSSKRRSKKGASSSKKVKDQATEKSKPLTKKTGVGTTSSFSQASTLKKSKSKKTTNNTAVKTPLKTQKPTDCKTVSLSDHLPTTTDVVNSLSQVNNDKTKKVKSRKSKGISDIETKSVLSEKTGNQSELKTTKTPSKKTKSNKVKHSVVDLVITSTPSTEFTNQVTNVKSGGVKTSIATDYNTVSSQVTSERSEENSKTTTPSEKVKDKKSVKSKEMNDFFVGAGTHIPDYQLTSDRTTVFETPKKVKSKKSDRSAEDKSDTDVLSSHSKPNQTESPSTNSTVKGTKRLEQPECVNTSTKKAKKSCLESYETEAPSKQVDIDSSVLFEADQATSSKKSKSKKSSKSDKESLSEKDCVDTGTGVVAISDVSISANLESSSKKKKRNRSRNLEQNPSPHDCSEMENCHHLPGTSPSNQVSSKPRGPKDDDNVTISEEKDAVQVEASPGSKKRKKDKKKKDMDELVLEAVPPTPNELEEQADSLLRSPKNKSKGLCLICHVKC